LFAVPTTAGTGSETTGVAIFDLAHLHAKTGIAHRRLKPTLGYLDPENTRTMPPHVAAATGLDVLSHAIESYTAIHYTERPAPERPILRPAYQGNNPISDVWSLHALKIVGDYIFRAVEDTSDDEARSQMILASAYAGIGFGNAGVHLPHGMSYPISGMVKGRGYRQTGYPDQPELIPHGYSVILNAPAVFRFTAPACPQRHLDAAAALGVDTGNANPADAGKILSHRITEIMERLKVPRGLKALGYSSSDIPSLVEGTLPQHRVTKLSPRAATPEDLARLFGETLQVY
jgi:hydroxyacid-oxoacid transhydrogenase